MNILDKRKEVKDFKRFSHSYRFEAHMNIEIANQLIGQSSDVKRERKSVITGNLKK